MQGQRPCTRSQPNKNKAIQKQRNKPKFIPLASVTRSQTRLKSLQDQPQMQEKMIDESMNDDSSTPQTSLQLRQRRPRRTKSFEPTERPKKSKRIQSKQKELARKFRKKRELTKSSHPKQWNSSFSYQQYSPSLDPISEKKESEEDKEGGQAKRQQQQAEQEAQEEKEQQEVLGEQREFGEIGSMLIIEKPESQEHIEAVDTPPHILGLSHHATFLDNTLPEQTSEVEHPEEQIYYEDIDISCYLNL